MHGGADDDGVHDGLEVEADVEVVAELLDEEDDEVEVVPGGADDDGVPVGLVVKAVVAVVAELLDEEDDETETVVATE